MGKTIFVCYNEKGLITKKSYEDNRRLLYKVKMDEEYGWVQRDVLIKYLNDSLYDVRNVKLRGNSIVLNTEQKKRIEKITSKNFNKMTRFVDNYLNSLSEEEYTYGYADYFSYLKETNYKNLLEEGYLGLIGNEISCFIVIDNNKSMDCSFIYFPYYNYNMVKDLYYFINEVSKKVKNSVFCFDYWIEDLKNKLPNFKEVNLNSSFSKKHRYLIDSGLYLTEYNPNIIVDYIEKKYFPDIEDKDLKDISFKCYTGKELEKKFHTGKFRDSIFSYYWINNCNIHSIVGFTYFKFENINSEDIKFLVAEYKGLMLGIIKFGVWPNSDHQSVSYIDVSLKYRNMGIATLLIKHLDPYLNKKMTLVLTDESEMGKKYNMVKKFKENIHSVKVKTYSECLEDGHYN